MFDFTINGSTHAIEILVDIYIAKPNHFQAIAFKHFGSEIIFALAFFIVMPAAVQFDDQFRPETVEIRNKAVNALLPLKPNRIVFQEAVP